MIPAVDAAQVLAQVSTEFNSAHGKARFPADLPVFAGHFPDQPLVPGVHQLALVAELVRQALGETQLELVGVSRCKWTLPLGPDEDLDIQARWQERGQELQVDGSVHRGGRQACNCRLLLRRPSAS